MPPPKSRPAANPRRYNVPARVPTGPLRRGPARDPNLIHPATRAETLPIGMAALVAGLVALSISSVRGFMLLYGDAVSHLGIARRIVDNNQPGLGQIGGVWLPLPHLLMLPFIGNMQWWQNGMAGAWPSLACYVIGTMGMFRLSRRLLTPAWALVATAFFGLNANLLYLSTTAMTEPLFLALFVWIVLLLLEFNAAIAAAQEAIATNRLLLLGLLNLAAVMTRYDGWILAAIVWCLLARQLWLHPAQRPRLLPAFATCTLLTAAGPIFWFWFNHAYAGDWLDFLRGPSSPKEIDRRTSPPGSHKYWGWHNPAWSLMLYARTAQVDAAAWETGWLVAAGALFGAWKSWFSKVADAATEFTPDRTALLLWLPLPFYVYSISYGSVPIFIPQLYPHSFYNSRYGMEMLPALAIFATFALALLAARFREGKTLAVRLMVPISLLLIVVNLLVMLHATPLVLKEAMVNSRGRLSLEDPLATQLIDFDRGAPILMNNSNQVGALQKAGIPLRQTIGPADYYLWRKGTEDPAHTALYIVAQAGEPLAEAVKAHPTGLTELSIICATNQPCVRIYKSDVYSQSATK